MHGDLDRAGDAVNLEPATKAAADQVVVDHDLVQRQPGGFCGGGLCPSDDLATDPDLATVFANIDGTVHGLHRRVGQKRNLIDRVDLGGGPRDCLGDIPYVLRDRSCVERSFFEITRDVLGAERRVRPVVPLNDQGREAFFRRPHMVGHDGNRIVQPHDLTHAFDCLGRRVVDAFQPAAEHGRLRERRDDAVAVVADHMGAAKKGLAALVIEWDDGPHAKLNTDEIAAELEKATLNPGAVAQNVGDVAKAMAGAVTKVEAIYQVPFLAHAAMEPMNCTVHVRKDGCEVWVGSQVIARAQAAAAKTAGLPLDKVVVHNHLIGGGFGRRLEIDGVIRAVQIASMSTVL